jgi:hypothetical protein
MRRETVKEINQWGIRQLCLSLPRGLAFGDRSLIAAGCAVMIAWGDLMALFLICLLAIVSSADAAQKRRA